MNKKFFLACNRIKNLGPRTFLKLLHHLPNLAELFELSYPKLQKLGLSPSLSKAISEFDFTSVELDLMWEARDARHHLITWEENHYPALLKEIPDAPPVLYANGNLDCLNQKGLAIVGSRKPSITGANLAKQFSRELSCYPITIISGLALGIDGEVHRGCLEGGGHTIAVLATGINRIYPQKHVQLAEEISHKGLVLSEFPLNTPPIAGHFPRRNRIISGLSLCTLVIEATLKSGSLITARLALEQNREVLAVPGSVYNLQAQGCHYLLREGAKLITSSMEILEELQISPSASFKNEDMRQTVECIEKKKNINKEQRLLKYIGFELTTIDELILRSGQTLEEISCVIATLELQGLLQAVPGGYLRTS